MKINSAPTIDVEIDDVLVRFHGDPPETALLELMAAQASFGSTAEDQIRGIGVLRGCLRGMTTVESRDAWDGLVTAEKITLGVTMQLFEHITDAYGDTLGFRGGSPDKSTSGRPENADTSEVSSLEPVAVPI